MRRLSGSDASFLYFEDKRHPSTIGYTVDLDPAPSGEEGSAITLSELRDHIGQRLDYVPTLKWRLRKVPFGLDHPYWVEEDEVDLDYHVSRHVLRAPGDFEEFEQLIGDIPDANLDPSKPLWKILLIDGFSDGSQVLFFQLSHALFDGHSSIQAIFDLLGDPNPEKRHPGSPDTLHETGLRLALVGVRRQLRLWLQMPSLVRLTLTNGAKARARRRELAQPVPRVRKDAPSCSLSNSFSADRAFAQSTIALAEFKKVKTAANVTFNDLLMAMSAGALRYYLMKRHDLPDKPLTTMVPVSLDSDDQEDSPRIWGNAVGNFVTTLATDIDDPWDRLQTISRVSNDARSVFQLLGIDLLQRWSEYLIPLFAKPLVTLNHLMSRTKRSKPLFNVIISNFPAPGPPFSFRGIPVVGFHCYGPLADTIGVNVTSITYGDQICLAVRSDPHALDNPRELILGLSKALQELEISAASRQQTVPVEPETSN